MTPVLLLHQSGFICRHQYHRRTCFCSQASVPKPKH